MTLPFFGSGIVELPPDGFKRAKNSRKMQMVFFVHQGKVLVTVGPPALENGGAGNDAETNEFAISKGGVWVVPRGMLTSLSSPLCTSSQQPFRARWKPHRHSRGNIASTRLCKKSGQRSLPAHLLLVFERCRAEAVCATSRRNNLSIAPEHRTSCVALHCRNRAQCLQALCCLSRVRHFLEGLHRRCQYACVCSVARLSLPCRPRCSGAGMSCDFAAPWLWQAGFPPTSHDITETTAMSDLLT